MAEDFKNPFNNSNSILSQLRKKQEEQNKKIEEEKARAARDKAERDAAEAERLRKEQEEKDRLEKERLAEEQRQQEEAERRRIAIETEARVAAEKEAEAKRQAYESEKNKRTLDTSGMIDYLIPQYEKKIASKPRKVDSFYRNLLTQGEQINRLDVYFERIANYEKFRTLYSQLFNMQFVISEKEDKRKKNRKILKKILLILVIIAAIAGMLYGIRFYTTTDSYKAKQSSNQQKKLDAKTAKAEKQRLKNYKVGAWGEAGIIFYDKGEYSDGWRFLEMAPDRIDNVRFADHYPSVTEIHKELGGGYINTQLLKEELDSDSAAYWAYTYEANGKDDWYLGNVAEMKMCFNNLVKNKKNRKKLEKFVTEGRLVKYYSTYWEWNTFGTMTYITSEPVSPDKCYTVIFSTSTTTLDGGKETAIGIDWRGFDRKIASGYKNYVRPIRRF